MLSMAQAALCAAALKLEAAPAALAYAMQGHRIVLLGEVHDNAAQHALRIAALRRLLATGVRPALAFEQFDRERQGDIDAARRARPRDADFLIERGGGDSAWDWRFYRPYVALALEFELPIVAANLSRADAMRVATGGWTAVFDARTIRDLRLDSLPAELRRKQEAEIGSGHCNLLPREMLFPRARAQIARDIVMARALRPYADRGVVLLAGNGHVRRDIGAPFWLPRDLAREAISIGLLESGNGADPASTSRYDAYLLTPTAERADPCAALERQMQRR
jgi:uncharacterized iron-regulated protein